MKKMADNKVDPEIAAISIVHKALEKLPSDAQARVLAYVARKLKINISMDNGGADDATISQPDIRPAAPRTPRQPETGGDEDGLEGISPVARKWMIRNGLDAKGLSSIFSLGVDEIDLVAREVPGKNKREKMRSVFLLKGVAAYLGNGAPRFTHEEVKEASLHYRAFDAGNFARALKSFSGEVSGDPNTGYSLTTRGLASATELVKAILQEENVPKRRGADD
jgi:hypothetical protein